MTPLDAMLLLLGLVAGLTMAAHGAQKVFGWFGGPGIRGWTSAVAGMGFRPARVFAWAAALAELIGGLGLALGALTSVAAALVLANAVVILFHVHWQHGFWNTERGVEYPLLIVAVVLVLGVVGRGMLSVDTVASYLMTAANGLGPVHSAVPPLAARIGLLLAGAIAGSAALAVPGLARVRGQAGRAGHGRAIR